MKLMSYKLGEFIAQSDERNIINEYGEDSVVGLSTQKQIIKDAIEQEVEKFQDRMRKLGLYELTTQTNEKGEVVNPDEPNSYKFETFIFDSFNYVDNIAILRGSREVDFAPVKNKEGVDSPETAKKLYNEYWKNHME